MANSPKLEQACHLQKSKLLPPVDLKEDEVVYG